MILVDYPANGGQPEVAIVGKAKVVRESDDNPHCQISEPVTPPPGFGPPRLKIGQRVRVALTVFVPKFLKDTEGKTGTVTCVVFCKSDGKTILYGVAFDGGEGGRYESFELDEIK